MRVAWRATLCRIATRLSRKEGYAPRFREPQGNGTRRACRAPLVVALRFVVCHALAVLGSAAFTAACGSNASSMSDGVSVGSDGGGGSDSAVADDVSAGGCGAGEQSCSSCNGGVFCAPSCPQIACPGTSEGGAFDAGGTEGGACAAGQVACLDCSGGTFCVAGSCPATTCPVRDAGTDGPRPADGAGDVRSDANTTSLDGGGPVCPGATPPPAGYPLCRSSADCTVPATCAPQTLSGCGACQMAQHMCTVDGDCGDGGATVCEPYTLTGGCICGATSGTRCTPKCTTMSCAANSTCLASGHCQATPCGQGYTCASDQTCKSGASGADAHGCIPMACTDGFACAADQECNAAAAAADTHGCAPLPCANGYVCPINWHCVAGTGADAHGCTPIPCSSSAPCGINESCDPTQPGRGCGLRKCMSDADCDCGACVESYCRSSLWICSTGAQ